MYTPLGLVCRSPFYMHSCLMTVMTTETWPTRHWIQSRRVEAKRVRLDLASGLREETIVRPCSRHISLEKPNSYRMYLSGCDEANWVCCPVISREMRCIPLQGDSTNLRPAWTAFGAPPIPTVLDTRIH